MEFVSSLGLERREWALVIFLGEMADAISVEVLARGAQSYVDIPTRRLFRRAAMQQAHGFILFHNHPSGIAEPSPEDMKVTRQIALAAEALDVTFVDHIIVVDGGFCSLRSRGFM